MESVPGIYKLAHTYVSNCGGTQNSNFSQIMLKHEVRAQYLLKRLDTLLILSLVTFKLGAHVLASSHKCDGIFQSSGLVWIRNSSFSDGLLSLQNALFFQFLISISNRHCAESRQSTLGILGGIGILVLELRQ